jgi:hypothetical protein
MPNEAQKEEQLIKSINGNTKEETQDYSGDIAW